jgi:hypothetical protein
VKGSVELRARKRHPYVYVAAAFGLLLLTAAVSAVATNATAGSNIAVALFALGLGSAVLASAAYAAVGTLYVVVSDDDWCTVTWKLGPFRRNARFPRHDVRSIESYTSPPFAVIWPSMAGRQLRVHIDRRRQPLDLAGGFQLDDNTLRSLEQLLGGT